MSSKRTFSTISDYTALDQLFIPAFLSAESHTTLTYCPSDPTAMPLPPRQMVLLTTRFVVFLIKWGCVVSRTVHDEPLNLHPWQQCNRHRMSPSSEVRQGLMHCTSLHLHPNSAGRHCHSGMYQSLSEWVKYERRALFKRYSPSVFGTMLQIKVQESEGVSPL